MSTVLGDTKMARRRRIRPNTRVQRSTYITTRSTRLDPLNDWPSIHLHAYTRVAKSYTSPNYRAVYRPLAAGQLTRRPRRHARKASILPPAVSGMHDTPFKRPRIAPYDVWKQGLAFLSPKVKTCVQRKQRRQAVFATTGGGSIRRKPNSIRNLRSQIGCK